MIFILKISKYYSCAHGWVQVLTFLSHSLPGTSSAGSQIGSFQIHSSLGSVSWIQSTCCIHQQDLSIEFVLAIEKSGNYYSVLGTLRSTTHRKLCIKGPCDFDLKNPRFFPEEDYFLQLQHSEMPIVLCLGWDLFSLSPFHNGVSICVVLVKVIVKLPCCWNFMDVTSDSSQKQIVQYTSCSSDFYNVSTLSSSLIPEPQVKEFSCRYIRTGLHNTAVWFIDVFCKGYDQSL